MHITFDQFNQIREGMTRNMESAGRVEFQDRHLYMVHPARMRRFTGLSSNAMVAYAFERGPRPTVPGHPTSPKAMSWQGDQCGRNDPADEDDLMACAETLRLARAMHLPVPVISRMAEVYREFWLWVMLGVNRHGNHIISTTHHPLPETVSSASI